MPLLLLLLACQGEADRDRDGHAGAADCDDLDAQVFPGAAEACDGRDEDCDGVVDEGVATTFFYDGDGDGHGDAARPTSACARPPGHRRGGEDCDDGEAEVFPGAPEGCDGLDQDCDGEVDEGVTTAFYVDRDGDGFGGAVTRACALPEGAVEVGGDCQDGDREIHPGAEEVCNGADDDCDGAVDEGPWLAWPDADGDGFGDPSAAPAQACAPPEGYADNDGDCDDLDASRYPEADELCDGADDDCDGAVDEGVEEGWWLVTFDREGNPYRIDPDTGAVTALDAARPRPAQVVSFDVREDGLAVVASNGDAGPELIEVDLCAQTTASLGVIDAQALGGVAFGPAGDLLAVDHGADTLLTIDLASAAVTSRQPLGFDLGWSGMAWSCADASLRVVDGPSGRLLTLDPSSGQTLSALDLDIPFASVGLEARPATGELLASTGTALYRLDPSTGASTLVARLPLEAVNDLALYPPCP